MLQYGTYAMEMFSKCLTSTGAIKHISRNIIISLIPHNQTHEIVFGILTRVAMVTIILTSLVYVVYKEKEKCKEKRI